MPAVAMATMLVRLQAELLEPDSNFSRLMHRIYYDRMTLSERVAAEPNFEKTAAKFLGQKERIDA